MTDYLYHVDATDAGPGGFTTRPKLIRYRVVHRGRVKVEVTDGTCLTGRCGGFATGLRLDDRNVFETLPEAAERFYRALADKLNAFDRERARMVAYERQCMADLARVVADNLANGQGKTKVIQ